MSILIKGMEMPKSCDNCWALDDCGDYPRCRITEEQRGYNFPIRDKRMDKCPLVEVQPHGRLIDLDKLDINRREEQAWRDWENNPDNEYLEGVRDGLHEAAKQLAASPIIIPADKEETE